MDLNIIIEEDGDRDPNELIIRKIKQAISLTELSKPIPEPPVIELKLDPKTFKSPIIKTRLTISVDDPSRFYKLAQSESFKKYEILAVEPINDKMLSQFCSGQFDCDILTLHMNNRLNVDLKRANLSLPQKRGICFEINYNHALFNQTNRQNTISSAQLLVEKSRGKNILISSGARGTFGLRGPYDVSNLGMLFGLKENQSKEAVFRMGQAVLRHSNARRNSNCNAVMRIDAPLNPFTKKEFDVVPNDPSAVSGPQASTSTKVMEEDLKEPNAKKIRLEG